MFSVMVRERVWEDIICCKLELRYFVVVGDKWFVYFLVLYGESCLGR